MYKPTDEWSGGHLLGYISAKYEDLVKLFGEPNGGGDDYKVSTEWQLKDEETGRAFYLYDWKTTIMYDPNYLSVEQFRKSTNLHGYDWHIGGTDESIVLDLIDYIGRELKK